MILVRILGNEQEGEALPRIKNKPGLEQTSRQWDVYCPSPELSSSDMTIINGVSVAEELQYTLYCEEKQHMELQQQIVTKETNRLIKTQTPHTSRT